MVPFEELPPHQIVRNISAGFEPDNVRYSVSDRGNAGFAILEQLFAQCPSYTAGAVLFHKMNLKHLVDIEWTSPRAFNSTTPLQINNTNSVYIGTCSNLNPSYRTFKLNDLPTKVRLNPEILVKQIDQTLAPHRAINYWTTYWIYQASTPGDPPVSLW
jgi:hypothetical protein